MRYVELRRHTDNDGDTLSTEGMRAAAALGETELNPPYTSFVSTGAQRATQMLEILRSAAGQDDVDIQQVPSLRSSVEDRWKSVAKAAGKGADLEALRRVDSNLVEMEAQLLGSALRQLLDELPEGGRALVVGHSPTNEAAVLGLVGVVIPPMGKGEGVLVTESGGSYQTSPL